MLFKSIETTTHALLVACKGQTLSLATCDSVDMFNTSAAPWAARYNTGLPIGLTLKGVIFPVLFFSTNAAFVMLAGAESEVDDEQLG